MGNRTPLDSRLAAGVFPLHHRPVSIVGKFVSNFNHNQVNQLMASLIITHQSVFRGLDLPAIGDPEILRLVRRLDRPEGSVFTVNADLHKGIHTV